MSTCTTEGITVVARPFFIPEKSQPKKNIFVYGYEIHISNQGDAPVQLVDRHWKITNDFGITEEISGEGVVGLQPHIEPGETFVYSSLCPLDTHYGYMRGIYGMLKPDGQRFEATIAPFVLMPSWMLN